MKNIIRNCMIKFIPKVALKNNKELKTNWVNNKVIRCLQRKYTYHKTYLSYLRHNYTTDGVAHGKL